MADKWDEKAAELLPCEHTENKPGYFGYNREQSECYGCIHRPAVAAELRRTADKLIFEGLRPLSNAESKKSSL